MIFDAVCLGVAVVVVGVVALGWRWFGDESWLADRPDGWRDQPSHFTMVPPPYDWEEHQD